VGANAIYPLLGQWEYGWRFVGADIDPVALENARGILRANEGLSESIELRLQPDPARIFEGVLREEERFECCLCNPPFHASLREAREGTQRKWRNLGRPASLARTALNFGGQGRELWCEGGEAAFIRRMIEESAAIPGRIRWFTTLVSKSSSLPAIRSALARARVRESRIIPMGQGQKQSRIVAWTFA
jgi:23S rRNA (adenine1618-N6)-methyltransferase